MGEARQARDRPVPLTRSCRPRHVEHRLGGPLPEDWRVRWISDGESHATTHVDTVRAMTSNEFDQLIAALQPGLLDWLSGLMVPLTLGGLTLLVAIWSIRVAKRGNDLAQRVHEETIREKRFERRLQYVSALRELNSALATFSMLGKQDDALLARVNERLTAEQEKSGEPSARKVLRWIAEFWENVGPLANSGRNLFELLETVEKGIDEWRQDPDAFMASVRADSRYVHATTRPVNPADPRDWRNP